MGDDCSLRRLIRRSRHPPASMAASTRRECFGWPTAPIASIRPRLSYKELRATGGRCATSPTPTFLLWRFIGACTDHIELT